jgi:ATP-dependent RNA helicase DDX21
VHADFEFYGATFGLSACCVYGGSPYRPQEMALRRGVDIVVGTPGRIKVIIMSLLIPPTHCIMSSFSCFLMHAILLVQDFIVKGTLNLKCLKFRVLDEADEMLNMGFVDDVELILGMLTCQFLVLQVLIYNFFNNINEYK